MKLISSLVEDIINPLIGVIVSNADLSGYAVRVGNATVSYGSLITTMIDFISIAAVFYWVFRGLGLDKLDKKPE